MNARFSIRSATARDVSVILKFIRELAEYEKLAHEVTATEEILRRSLFSEKSHAEVILAREGEEDVGFAVFFHNFSTFLGKPGLYLEDLFVRPAYRGRGYGKALVLYLARLARDRGCGRFEWAVLDWNKPSIDFYRSLGAVPMNDWTVFRVTGKELEALASQPMPGD
jgi:GNAT superfamily N-acetyltransferase